MRTPNTCCTICDKPLYRRPFEFKKVKKFCCVLCRGKLYKANPSVWSKNLSLGTAWNKGMSKKNGDVLSYGKPRAQITRLLISKKLKGRIFTNDHKKRISQSRLTLFDRIGRKIPRSAKFDGRYQRWRRQVLERDGYTCRQCGGNDDLHTHHVKPWRYFPELRYEPSNGMTLCIKCHRKTDSWGCKKLVLLQE